MLWIPGPTEVRPEILAACASPAIGHRSQAMRDLIARLDPHLRLAFGLAESSTSQVATHSVSASGMMEASLRGVGPRVLCVENGAFSRRYRQMAEILGKQVTTLEVTWGEGVTPDALRRALEEQGPFDAVTLVCNETSTGVRTPLASVAGVMRDFADTMLLVDLVSYIAGAPVDFDVHGLDFGLAGVQKAFAVPPGITVFCASERYVERARSIDARSWCLDPVKVLEGHVQRKTPATPATPQYFGLAQQLEDITNGVTLPEGERHKSGAEAWQARFERHQRMQRRTAEWAAGHGLELYPAAEFASPTVSCVAAGSLDVAHLVAGLKERGYEISNGYGDLKGKTFRIGHMGDHTEQGLEALLAAADEVLARAKV